MKLDKIDELKSIGIFVKFIKSEFAESLLEGNLYMNNLHKFIGMEKESKKKGQGDKYEGAFVSHFNRFEIKDESGKVFIRGKDATVTERYDEVIYTPIFCITRFSSEDCKVVEEDDKDNVIFKLDLKQHEKDLFKSEFGDKAILLPGEFPVILEKELQEQGYKSIKGLVDYYNYKKFDLDRKKKFDEKSAEMVFWKDNFFSYQREYRFAITNKLVENNLTVKIKNDRTKFIILDTDRFLDMHFRINKKELKSLSL